MDLSILIATMSKRHNIIHQILNEVKRQLQTVKFTWEILVDCDDGEKTLGQKRNDLVKAARGEYILFLDDDDALHPEFFKTYEPMFLDRTYDIGELYGLRYDRNVVDRPVHYSIGYAKYVIWYNDEIIYIRSPCHLTPMRTSIARTIGWIYVTEGEDREFSKRLSKFLKVSRPLKEFPLPDTTPLYHYLDSVKDIRDTFIPRFDAIIKQFKFLPYTCKAEDSIKFSKGINLYDATYKFNL